MKKVFLIRFEFKSTTWKSFPWLKDPFLKKALSVQTFDFKAKLYKTLYRELIYSWDIWRIDSKSQIKLVKINIQKCRWSLFIKL